MQASKTLFRNYCWLQVESRCNINSQLRYLDQHLKLGPPNHGAVHGRVCVLGGGSVGVWNSIFNQDMGKAY